MDHGNLPYSYFTNYLYAELASDLNRILGTIQTTKYILLI